MLRWSTLKSDIWNRPSHYQFKKPRTEKRALQSYERQQYECTGQKKKQKKCRRSTTKIRANPI